MKFRSIKGTRDVLPGEVEQWQHLEQMIHAVMHTFSYREIRTPVFESTALFSHSIGELTDIVGKEMYTFTDRSGESVTLRPEGTAAVLRAYLQNNLGEQAAFTKLYYIAPMFRQERPQAGRLRQFHQFGAEAIGSDLPELDVEMIMISLEILKAVRITDARLRINTVGCENCRPRYKELLVKELLKIEGKLSPDSKRRVRQNPLRVLDSKDETDQKLTASIPLMKDHLCPDCRDHFSKVQSLLKSLGIACEVDGRLVRGLDYYTRTAFEITSAMLGAQDALVGGGRYDLLAEELGGKPTPSTGFAAGMERILMVLGKGEQDLSQWRAPILFLAGIEEADRTWAFLKACELRSKGISVETDYLGRSLKAQMREANRLGTEYVVVIGEQERTSGFVKLKNMKSGKETSVRIDSLESSLS